MAQLKYVVACCGSQSFSPYHLRPFNRGNDCYWITNLVWSCQMLFRRSLLSERSYYHWRLWALSKRRPPLNLARHTLGVLGPLLPSGHWVVPSYTCPLDGKWSCWSGGWNIPSIDRSRTRIAHIQVWAPDGVVNGTVGKLFPGQSVQNKSLKWRLIIVYPVRWTFTLVQHSLLLPTWHPPQVSLCLEGRRSN